MGPVLALVVFNTVIFIIIIVVLIKHTRRRLKRTNEKKLFKTTLQTLISIIGIVSIFGLTWLFGAFTATQQTQLPFLILFVVFSSFQGFFVFVFLCIVNKDAREAWIQLLTRGKYKTNKTYTSKSSHAYPSKPDGRINNLLSSKTASTVLKHTPENFHKSAHESSCSPSSPSGNEYDIQEIQLEMYHTAEEEVYLNEGALDTDDSMKILTNGKNSPVLASVGFISTNCEVVTNPNTMNEQ